MLVIWDNIVNKLNMALTSEEFIIQKRTNKNLCKNVWGEKRMHNIMRASANLFKRVREIVPQNK